MLLSPDLLGAGIKTTVLETSASGTPVTGIRDTFEGMGLREYPLAGPLKQLIPEVSDRTICVGSTKHSRLGNDYVRRPHDTTFVAAVWRTISAALDQPLDLTPQALLP